MKSGIQIAPTNTKKPEALSSKKKIESATDIMYKRKTMNQKDVRSINVKTPDDASPKQRTPRINSREKDVKPPKPGKPGIVEEPGKKKKREIQKKTVNLIIKKSFTYVDSGTSIAVTDKRGNSKNLKGLPPKSPKLEGRKDSGKRIPANVEKATKPVTPVKNITMPKILSKPNIASEEVKKITKKVDSPKKVDSGSKSPKSTGSSRRLKKRKEWDDNFSTPSKESKEEEKKKKVNFQVDVYRELMTQALASSSKKMLIDQGKSKFNDEKRFKAKSGQQKGKESPTRSKSKESPMRSKSRESPIRSKSRESPIRSKSKESHQDVQVDEKAPDEEPKEPEEVLKKTEDEQKEIEEVPKESEQEPEKPEEMSKKSEEEQKELEQELREPEEVPKELEEELKEPEEVPKNLEEEPKKQELSKPEEDPEPVVEEPAPIEEVVQPVELVEKGSIIDKLRHELQMNIFNKLYLCSKKTDSKEKVAEVVKEPKGDNLMGNINQTKRRWNLKSCPLKRKRIKGTVDDRCNASLTDAKLYDDAIIKLKRHNTEPHSYRGFIWRHSSEIPNNCNDYSVTSLASSLKHLNTDDLEDFVFWETVPPKSTSCWEVSLYQSKKPWSVLSCSIFQSNRLSDTPGVILENLRSGNSYDSRISYSPPVKPLPKSISFDVEPSIAQKNIDIRNWVAALNFETPEPPPILSERTSPQEIGKSVHNAPSDCTIKEKKLKMKHGMDGKKTPGKRARSAFDEHTKMQLSIPPAENMSLIKGVFVANGIKVLDYDKKHDTIKTLITGNHSAKDQTKLVYMMHVSNKSPLKSVRKSRDGRKSQGEPSQGKSRENTVRSHTPARKSDSDEALDGLVRKGSGGFVTVEQYMNKDGKIEKRANNFSEKIVNLTDFGDEGISHDSDDARPYSQGKKHKHEGEATGVCCLGEFRTLNPEESRKARMDYGKFALNKEIEAKKKARAKSRTRSRTRTRQPSSLLRLVTRRYSSDENTSVRVFPKIFLIFFMLLVGGSVTAAWKFGWLSLIYLMNFKEEVLNFLNFLKF